MDLMNKKQPNLQSKTINMTIWPELSAKMTMIDIQWGYSPFQGVGPTHMHPEYQSLLGGKFQIGHIRV